MIETKQININRIPGYNFDICTDTVNILLGTDVEIDLADQSWGTDCYGICRAVNSFNYTITPFEEFLKSKKYHYHYDIINYLRLVGELPNEDLLYEISY